MRGLFLEDLGLTVLDLDSGSLDLTVLHLGSGSCMQAYILLKKGTLKRVSSKKSAVRG
jgi:hypothetical protein